MRWDDDGDGGDDVDDDPDDARCDDDLSLWEGISPTKSPRQESISSLCGFRREEAAEKLGQGGK